MFQNRVFPFIHITKRSIFLTGIFLLGSVFLIAFKGIPWGIDFTGGKTITLRVQKEISPKIEELVSTFPKKIKLRPLESSETEVTFELQGNLHEKEVSDLRNSLLSAMLPKKGEILQESFVGSKIGKEFKKSAIWASILSLIAIFIFISLRFEFLSAFAALFALLHDVLLSTAFITLLEIPFNLDTLAPILFLIGYSLNDTIVIFDRIREKLSVVEVKNKPMLIQCIDESLTISLSRSLLTSLTTLMTLLVLYFLSASELQNFSIILIFGVIVGTFSSNFVAPYLLLLKKHSSKI